jgi:hypothetical protein
MVNFGEDPSTFALGELQELGLRKLIKIGIET